MAKFTFNIAKGAVRHFASLPQANDAWIAVPLESSGLEVDPLLCQRATLADLLAGSTNEQTTLGRKTLTGVTVTTDITTNTVKIDADDFVYGGGSGNPIAAIVVCYVPDTTVTGDAAIVPLLKFDFSAIPSGTDIPVQIAATGLAVISDAA